MIIDRIDKIYTNVKSSAERTGLHASSIGKCSRELYYEATNKKAKEIEPRVRRIFEMGDSVHQRFMRTLFRIPDIRVIAGELPMPDNELIKGTCDAIVAVDNDNYILDFKSINSSGFEYLDDAKPDHKLQVLVYMYYFKINKGVIIYENKDTQALKEFIIVAEENQDLMKQALNKIKYIDECIRNKIVPGKPVFGEDEKWRCLYCNYKEECSIEENLKGGKDENNNVAGCVQGR